VVQLDVRQRAMPLWYVCKLALAKITNRSKALELTIEVFKHNDLDLSLLR